MDSLLSIILLTHYLSPEPWQDPLTGFPTLDNREISRMHTDRPLLVPVGCSVRSKLQSRAPESPRSGSVDPPALPPPSPHSLHTGSNLVRWLASSMAFERGTKSICQMAGSRIQKILATVQSNEHWPKLKFWVVVFVRICVWTTYHCPSETFSSQGFFLNTDIPLYSSPSLRMCLLIII